MHNYRSKRCRCALPFFCAFSKKSCSATTLTGAVWDRGRKSPHKMFYWTLTDLPTQRHATPSLLTAAHRAAMGPCLAYGCCRTLHDIAPHCGTVWSLATSLAPPRWGWRYVRPASRRSRIRTHHEPGTPRPTLSVLRAPNRGSSPAQNPSHHAEL